MDKSEWIDELTKPTPGVISSLKNISGDIMVLGAGGKMGPSLIQLLQRILAEDDSSKEIYAVSRFSDPAVEEDCRGFNTIIVKGDLLDDAFLRSLPKVENVFYLVGFKFGASGNEGLTWAMNAYLPGRIATHFQKSRIVAFSTGNVYPLVSVVGTGATEETAPDPIGEYAQSCLGRERVFSYFSKKFQTKMLFYRLNYALDLRYGVLNDIARTVWNNEPVDLAMGFVNVIWQGDANNYAIKCLEYCSTPAAVLNITGPEKLAVKSIAERLAELMGRKVQFKGQPQSSALLSDSTKALQLMGKPRVTADQLIDWTAQWIHDDGEQLGKPTHFQERKGKF